MRVLIVDDNEINRKLLRVTLRSGGHETADAVDGLEALEKLRSGKCDAVISDILMPRMDGYRFCYEIRKSKELRDLPVIIYSSTYTSDADEHTALSVGADRFIRKPAAAEVILDALTQVTSARHTRRKSASPPAELDALKEYSEGLVRKLEQKNVELEVSRRDLTAANDGLRRSEEQIRLLLDSTAEGIYGLDSEGRFTLVNAACLKLLGYAAAEALLGEIAHDKIHHTRPDGTPYPAEECGTSQAHREGSATHSVEQVFWKADGTSFPVEYWSYPVRKNGTLIGSVVTFLDITERRRSEEAIQKLLRAVEQAKNVIFMTAPNGAITYVNPAFERVYGYSKDEALGKTPRILKSGRQDPSFYEGFWRKLLSGEAVREEFVNKRHDGELVIVEGFVSSVLDAQGRRIGYIAVQDDVTERKRTEEALRKSEKRFSLAFNASPIPTIISELETGRMLDVNEQFVRTLGYSRDELMGRTSKELKIWVDPGERDVMSERVSRQRPVRDKEIQIRTRSGEIRDVVGSAVRIDVGSIPCVLFTFLDVTERRRAERESRINEERFRRLLDSNTIGIAVADLSGRIFEANDAYVRILGHPREELFSGTVRWNEITPSEHRDRDQVAVRELQSTGVAQPWEKEFVRKDGSRVQVLIGVAMLGESEGRCIAYVVDLSSQKQLEEQLRQAQKMEAIGQLAGGVAHDFNNLLTAILGYSGLLATEVGDQSPLLESIDEIRKAGERAAALTRQLLAFSRKQVLEPKVLDLNALIANLEKMLGRVIGEDILLNTALGRDIGRIRADAGQIEQVVLNLAVNARDAMPSGGTLTIETQDVDLDQAYARDHVSVRPGRYVMLAVTDTGTGMSAETKSHMFEPFFTTKGQGKGTGLGLATVYGIVKQSGGNVWVYSELGRGTTFKIYLPRVEGAVEAQRAADPRPPAGGAETILLVEDDESVRSLTRRLLAGNGYTVLEASSAEEALQAARDLPGPIHLLLTDVVMPEIGGSDLASLIGKIRPGIKVLYMSGYTDDAIVRQGLVAEGVSFLQKPFTPATLARKVREVLS